MMGLFTLICLVLVVKFVGAQSGTEVIIGEFGTSFPIWQSDYGESVIELKATHNNINYDLLKLKDDHLEYGRWNRRYKFYLNKVSYDQAGEWRINSLVSKYGVEIRKYNVIHLRVVKSNEKLLPTTIITGEEGSYATLYFEKYFDNITSCYLTSSKNSKKYTLSNKSNDAVAGFEIYGKCGVRMLLNSSWPTEWILSQENEKSGVMSAKFTVSYKSKSILPEQRSEIWNLGSDQTVIKMDSDVKFCELEKPNGLVIPLHSQKCAYTVKQVDISHGGTWKLRYVPTYSMNVVNQEILVSVIDPQKIDWIVTKEENGVTHLQCQTFREEIDYCLFTAPNGNIINAMPAFGNEKYEYYGATHRTVAGKNYSQCGLTTRNPSDEVNGLWTCTIRSSAGTLNAASTYVSTNGHEKKEDERLRITTDKVYVKLGDEFTVKCKTERSLKYCSLRSPNGTVYSVTKNRGNVPNHLPYTGEGLSAGVCGAYIEKANETHNGDWTCLLGVSSEDSEIESTVSVKVTKAYIIQEQKSINVDTHKETKLLVSVFPNKELTIKYCRWVHPNGQRFYGGNAFKYPREQNKTSCSVTLKEVHQEDLGTWSCYVGFTGSDEETYTTIELLSKGQTESVSAVNVSVVILLTITIICGIICGFLLCKKRSEMQLDITQTPPTPRNEFQLENAYTITSKKNVY